MKHVTRPQYSRLKRILEMIREGTRAGRYPNAGDFGGELEVSRPTIMRDLEWLRDEENAPIEYVASSHGYRLSDQAWNLPPLQLSRKEVFAFSIASKLLAHFRGTPLEMDMRSVVAKIAESLEGTISMDPQALTDRFTVIGEDYVVQDPATWAAVAKAMDDHEEIRIVYEKFDGQVGTYVLWPYHLMAYHGNWYIAAGQEGKDEPLTFAVSRIRSVEVTGRRFKVPGSFDAARHMANAFGIIHGDKPFRVRLLFSKNVSGYIRERVWHPGQRMTRRRDGGVELRFETAGWKELVRWILSWQPDVKVLSPRRLRDRVKDKMRQGLCGP